MAGDSRLTPIGPRIASDVVRLACDLADALDTAANVEVVSGALHPPDVLLVADYTRPASSQPRITGLGVSAVLERAGVHAPVRRPYTAPERLAGAAWDRRADVFSLAAMVHELLWGRPIAGVGGAVADARLELPGADLELLRAAFERALAVDPAHRFSTARDFAAALSAAIPISDSDAQAEPLLTFRPESHATDAPCFETIGDFEIRLEESPPPIGEDESSSVGEGESRRARHDEPARSRTRATHTASQPERQPERSPHADAAAARGPVEAPGGNPRLVMDDERRQGARFRDAAEQPLEPPGGSGVEDGRIPPLDRTGSAIWPLALALLVGLAVGFGAGYGVGSRERTATSADVPASGMAGFVGPGRDHAEGPVDNDAAPAGAIGTMPRTSSSPSVASGPAAPSTAAAASGPKSGSSGVPAKSTAHGSTLPAPAALGRLLIRSMPAGARVFVDGREHGRSPALVRDLARGEHRVRLVREGYDTDERRVTITASGSVQPLTVRLTRTRPSESTPAVTARHHAGEAGGQSAPPARSGAQPAHSGAQNPVAGSHDAGMGSLGVESRPLGVRVFVDGRLVGVTPLVLPQVPAGEHVVRLEQTGYREWSSTIQIVPGERSRVTGSLEEKQPQ
jgi:hypothetical protein